MEKKEKEVCRKIVLEQAPMACFTFGTAYFLFYFQLLNSHLFIQFTCSNTGVNLLAAKNLNDRTKQPQRR